MQPNLTPRIIGDIVQAIKSDNTFLAFVHDIPPLQFDSQCQELHISSDTQFVQSKIQTS